MLLSLSKKGESLQLELSHKQQNQIPRYCLHCPGRPVYNHLV